MCACACGPAVLFGGFSAIPTATRKCVCVRVPQVCVCVFHQFTVLFDKNGRKYGRNSIQENIRMKI